MTVSTVDTIERSVHKTNEWLNELSEELGVDERSAWRMLRAYLQTLRDELTVDEAAQLAAQFPTTIRGAFYEGFDPSSQPAKLRHREAFLERLADRGQLEGTGEAARVAAAATRVLRRHITEGEFDDALSQLPSDVRELLQSAA